MKLIHSGKSKMAIDENPIPGLTMFVIGNNDFYDSLIYDPGKNVSKLISFWHFEEPKTF